MKKTVILAALIATVAILLTACGGGDPDPCELQPGQPYLVNCPACTGNDQFPCPPLMPPGPCGPSGCNN